MERNNSEQRRNLSLIRTNDSAAVSPPETRESTTEQQQQPGHRHSQNLSELNAALSQNGEDVTRLSIQLRESNQRLQLQNEKIRRINAVRRKISRVADKVSADYEHFLRLVEENRDMNDDGIRECQNCLDLIKNDILRRILAAADRFETETLPPVKNAILRAFNEGRAEVEVIGERVAEMRRRDEELRKQIIERRVAAVRRESSALRRQTAEAQARAETLRRAAEEARVQAREAAINAELARRRLNRARIAALQRVLMSEDSFILPRLMALLPEIMETASIGDPTREVALVEATPTSNEATSGSENDGTNAKQIEGMILMAAIFANILTRKTSVRVTSERKDERDKQNQPDAHEMAAEADKDGEENAAAAGEATVDILSKLEGNCYPRPEVGPLDDRLRMSYGVTSRLAEGFEEEIKRDVEFLQRS